VDFEGQSVPLFHLSPRQIEIFCRPPAGMMIPPIVEEYIADIQKQRRDLG
jgi:hypothetical protein